MSHIRRYNLRGTFPVKHKKIDYDKNQNKKTLCMCHRIYALHVCLSHTGTRYSEGRVSLVKRYKERVHVQPHTKNFIV